MIYYIYSLIILLVSVNSICNYIAVNNVAYQLDTCAWYSTKTGTSRGYFCIINETTGTYQAQFEWWDNSIDCGATSGEEATVTKDTYECGGADDYCYCNGGNEADCDIAEKITFGGEPGNCNVTVYESESLVLDVCIPSASETISTSKIVKCVSAGIGNTVYSTTDCSGDVTETNTDDIDSDTCYEIVCDSGINKLSYTCTYIIVMVGLLIKLL